MKHLKKFNENKENDLDEVREIFTDIVDEFDIIRLNNWHNPGWFPLNPYMIQNRNKIYYNQQVYKGGIDFFIISLKEGDFFKNIIPYIDNLQKRAEEMEFNTEKNIMWSRRTIILRIY